MALSTLRDILSKNADTEIGKKWKFASICTLEDYRKRVPLTTYEVYRPYIDQMVTHGTENLIATGRVIFYAPTSGTLSKSKLFPRFSHPPKLSFPTEKKIMLLVCWHKDKTTQLGVPITPANTAVIGATIDNDPSIYAAPLDAYAIQDMTTALYVQLLFGLKDTTVEIIWSPFSTTALAAFTLIEKKWEQMVFDIRNGSLNSALNLTESQVKAIEEAIEGPDQKRADELQLIFEEAKSKNFESLALKLWPKLSIVDALAGGSFAAYIPRLNHYLGADVDLYSSVYAASEGPGIFGINKWPHEHISAYSLQTTKVFFEFIPLTEVESVNPTVLVAEEIKADEVYELVLTTTEGLYRYRIGDLIKVLKVFPDSSEPPVVDVLGRTKMTLSVYAEKLNEFHLTAAFSALCNGPWKSFSVADFIVTADFSTVPPCHNFWIGVKVHKSEPDSMYEHGVSPDYLMEGASFIDTRLAEVNGSYANGRSQNFIGPPIITLVAAETFAAIINKLKMNSPVTETQLKMPHITSNPEFVEILQKNII